jgi:hypothetical protein
VLHDQVLEPRRGLLECLLRAAAPGRLEVLSGGIRAREGERERERERAREREREREGERERDGGRGQVVGGEA